MSKGSLAIGRGVAQAYYRVCRLFRHGEKILFLSRQSKEKSYSFARLEKAFKTARPAAKVVCINKMLPASTFGRALYLFSMLRQIYHIATARIVVLEGYMPAVSVIKIDPDTVVGQIWHAPGAIKKFGFQIVGKNENYSEDIASSMRMHRGYTVIFAAGKGCVAPNMEGFGYPEDAFCVTGTPECDYCFENDEACETRLRNSYPELFDGRKVVLWAPTFMAAMDRNPEVIDAFAKNLSDKCVLVCTLHPLSGNGNVTSVGGDNTGHIKMPEGVVVPEGFSTREMLGFCDAVISDYSSLVFYAAIRNVPTYFLVSDLEEYTEYPGFNLNPEEVLPSVTYRDAALAARAISKELTEGPISSEFLDFCKDYMEGCEPGATERIVKILLERSEISV